MQLTTRPRPAHLIFDTTDDGDYIHVIADIPAAGARIFGRLMAKSAQ